MQLPSLDSRHALNQRAAVGDVEDEGQVGAALLGFPAAHAPATALSASTRDGCTSVGAAAGLPEDVLEVRPSKDVKVLGAASGEANAGAE